MSISTAKRVLKIEADGLLQLSRKIGKSFDQAVKLILKNQGRVVVTGMGKSGLIGHKISATLSSTGTPSHFLSPAEALHGDMGRVTKADIILALSNSGETDELKILLPHLKRMGCKIILVTGNLHSTLSKLGDVVIDAGVAKEACPLNLSPTASTTAALGLGDALAIALLEENGFTEKDFALFHPGGDLGRRLQMKVSVIMRKGSAIPKVKSGASFQAIVKEISAKKMGCTLVVDGSKLKGIIVDGDLRRAMLKNSDIRRWNADNLKTPKPTSVPSETSLAHALQLMEVKTIYQLVVVDKQKRPVGLVHLHDLLGRGQIQIG